MAKLTPKQDSFVKAYLLNGGNATQAAIDAGYSKNTAKVIGSENLTKPAIKSRLDEEKREINEKYYSGILSELKSLRGEVARLKLVVGESSSKRKPSQSNRYQVMMSAGFKCQCCGASPSKDGDVTLHLDHVAPFSKGGSNEVSNLQSLCSDCNIAKSNHYSFNHNEGW